MDICLIFSYTFVFIYFYHTLYKKDAAYFKLNWILYLLLSTTGFYLL